MEHGQVVFWLLRPANQQITKPVEPGMRALYHPAAGFLTSFFSLDLFASGPNVGRVAQGGHHLAHLGIIVARIQAQPLLATGG